MSKPILDLKGEMTMLNVLHLQEIDLQQIYESLKKKRDEAPQFFLHSPLIVDCDIVKNKCSSLDFHALFEKIQKLNFIPTGIRNVPKLYVKKATQAKWAVLRDVKHKKKIIHKEITDSISVAQDIEQQSLLVIKKPIRSGQQISSPYGDIVVLQHTSAGSEVLAGGSIHVYGAIHGRVLAGINGDKSARIFCQKLDAELISIAGYYQLLDELETPLKNQPAMIYLKNNKLVIEAMI